MTAGPSSPVKKPKPRSPSPAMNTHPMMTRSKARAPCDKCHKLTHHDDFGWYEKDDIGVCHDCEYELYEADRNDISGAKVAALARGYCCDMEENKCETCGLLFRMGMDSCDMCSGFCDICDGRPDRQVGCCRDGQCPNSVDNMCDSCGTWCETTQQWFCPDCADAT